MFSYREEIRGRMLNWLKRELLRSHRFPTRSINLACALMDSSVWRADALDQQDQVLAKNLFGDPDVPRILADPAFIDTCGEYDLDRDSYLEEIDAQVRWWIADQVSDEIAEEVCSKIKATILEMV